MSRVSSGLACQHVCPNSITKACFGGWNLVGLLQRCLSLRTHNALDADLHFGSENLCVLDRRHIYRLTKPHDFGISFDDYVFGGYVFSM